MREWPPTGAVEAYTMNVKTKMKKIIWAGVTLIALCQFLLAENRVPDVRSGSPGAVVIEEDIVDRARRYYEKAKEKLNEYDHDRTVEEMRKLYEEAKERGEEVPQDIYEWAKEDIRRMDTWEYTILKLNPAELEEQVEAMNALGKERWECVDTVRIGDEIVAIFKRPVRSYLRHVPLRELLWLLPAGGEGGS